MGELRPIGAVMRLEQRADEESKPCPGCGEPGTWGDAPGVCPSCTEKQSRQDWPRALAACGVPLAYRDVPAELKLPPVLRGWKGAPWAVTLLGLTGTGKTWLAVRLLGGLYCGGLDGCLFADTAQALDLIRSEIDTPRDGQTFDRLVRARALLLDDVTAPRNTDYERDRLVLLLRQRYNRLAPTIITGNKQTLEELTEERLDGPIGSRLALGPWIEVKGRDRRLPKEAKP